MRAAVRLSGNERPQLTAFHDAYSVATRAA